MSLRPCLTPIAAAACTAIVALAEPVPAQTIEGRLLDRDTHVPVTGAFIVLIDASGARVAHGLTDDAGRFSVRAPAAGAYAVKVERIGYRTWTAPPRHVGGRDTVREDLTVSAIPIQLDAVVVRADHDCRVRPAEGEAAAVLWEEARKALSAADWAEREGWFQYVVGRYEHDLDPSLRLVREELRSSDTLFTRSPFVSPPATELAEQGYVRVQPDGSAHYFAPDADALLSDAFLDGHCFRVQEADRRHRGMVGLAFEPARRRDRPDIAGVLWLDSATAELRTLEFDFTNFRLAGFGTERAAGFVQFRRVASGAWVVSEWWIRMPLLAVSEDRLTGVRRSSVSGYRVAGGRVRAVTTERGTRRFDMATGVVTGTVSLGDDGARLAGVTVSLAGSAYSATTDELGRFRIAEVPAGRYAARAVHTAFALFGTPDVEVDVREGDVTTVRLISPSAAEIAAKWCDAGLTTDGTAILLGVVRHAESGAPVPEATVEALHQDVLDAVATPRNPSGRRGDLTIVSAARSVSAVADDRGMYVLCGLPHGVPLTVRVRDGRDGVEPLRLELENAEVRNVDLRVQR